MPDIPAEIGTEFKQLQLSFGSRHGIDSCAGVLLRWKSLPVQNVHSELKQSMRELVSQNSADLKLLEPDSKGGTIGIESSGSLVAAGFFRVATFWIIGAQLLRRYLRTVQPVCSPRQFSSEPIVLSWQPGNGEPELTLRTHRLAENAAFHGGQFARAVARRIVNAAIELLLRIETPPELRIPAMRLIQLHEDMFKATGSWPNSGTAWDEVIRFGGLYLAGMTGAMHGSPNMAVNLPVVTDSMGNSVRRSHAFTEYDRWLVVCNLMLFVRCMLSDDWVAELENSLP